MGKDLTDKQYWDKGYKNFRFSPMSKHYPIVNKIYKNFLETTDKSVFEIGCFPGRFLFHFGKLGYELNGIDMTEYLSDMTSWFLENSFKMGVFTSGDFFKFFFEKKYDVVFSSGFIEHFTNFDDVIRLHADLVKPGGYIFITTPNFAGSVQKKLHTIFDEDNLEKHYLPSMDPQKWVDILKRRGFSIVESGYFGGFDFWVGPQKRSMFEMILLKISRIFLPIRFLPNHKSYSPEIILIARKTI